MSIEIKNLDAIDKAVKARMDALDPAFQDAVEAEKAVIIKRTQDGVDVDGRAFEPYSKNGKHPWRETRIRYDKQVEHVDLTFSGAMFNALKIVFKKEGMKSLATFFFDNDKQRKKAMGHQTGLLGLTVFAPRRFFGLSQSQRETIVKKLRNVK